MLLRTLFLLAMIAVIGETIVHASGALAKAALHRRALVAAHSALASATQTAQQAIATAMQEGTPLALPAASSTCALATRVGCALVATTDVRTAPVSAAASKQCPDTNCVIYTQANDTVSEDRITIAIVVSVAPASGDAVAQRASTVTFRTMHVPPYAVIAGSSDATLDALTNGGTGDDGGANVAGAGTLVNIVYRNGATTIPANVWGSRAQNPQTSIPSWDR